MLEVEYEKKFLRDLALIPKRNRKDIEEFVFKVLPSYNAIGESGGIEKMKGYKNYFKIRFGDYRIGLFAESGRVVLKRVLNRKEIYRYFP